MSTPKILYNGDSALCSCSGNEKFSGPTGAAALAINREPNSMETTLSVAPQEMTMTLSSGRPALRRQTSNRPEVDKKEKILAWIQSKSAYGSNHTVGGAERLKQQMAMDFLEWLGNFCVGEGKYVLKNQTLLKFSGEKVTTDSPPLNSHERENYCNILQQQLSPNHRKDYGDDDAKAPFMYCGFPPFPPLFPKESDYRTGEIKENETPNEKEKEKRFVLICARDAYRNWWINKHTIKKDIDNVNETSGPDKILEEYWLLLQRQKRGKRAFDDFFLLEGDIDEAIRILTKQKNINLKDIVMLERQTSVDSFITLLKTIGNKKRGGRRKRKSKKRTRKKKGGRKSRRKRRRRKTKKRKTNRKKRKTKRKR